MKNLTKILLVIATFGFSVQSHAFLDLLFNGVISGQSKKDQKRVKMNRKAPRKAIFDCKIKVAIDGNAFTRNFSLPVVKDESYAIYFIADSFKEGRDGEVISYWNSKGNYPIKRYKLPTELAEEGIEFFAIGVSNLCSAFAESRISVSLGTVEWFEYNHPRFEDKNGVKEIIKSAKGIDHCLSLDKTYNHSNVVEKNGRKYGLSISCNRR